MQTGGSTFSKTGGVTRLSDWPIGQARDGRTRYSCPEDVFEHDYDRLVRALTIVAGDRETAADAVQEAFVRRVRGWDRLATYEDPAGWVRRVALNQIRDHQRSIWDRPDSCSRIETAVPRAAGSLGHRWRSVGATERVCLSNSAPPSLSIT